MEEARRATRQEKAERAMAVREKMLHEFGMKVSSVRNLRPSLSLYSLEQSRVHPSLPPLLMPLSSFLHLLSLSS